MEQLYLYGILALVLLATVAGLIYWLGAGELA